jgi:hypothetical protein
MNNIFAITTHHEDPIGAAEAWKRDGVCAIGFVRKGKSLRRLDIDILNGECRLFLKITKGDLILAYATGNMIAYIGEVVDGKCLYNNRNEVGDSFDYPNQFKVKWWPEPNHYQRTDLPQFFSDQLGRRGKTVVRLELGSYSVARAINAIKACANTNSARAELNEDMIKIGLHDYLTRHVDFIPGVRIQKAEFQLTPDSRPDFIGVDTSGRKVLIECKATATAAACDQLLRYKKAHGGRPRLLLVASRIDDACRMEAKKHAIELIHCVLKPVRVS